jgi:hypothetical protein
MDRKEVKKPNNLEEIIQDLAKSRYHGSITIHFSHGQGKKIEYKRVEDLND